MSPTSQVETNFSERLREASWQAHEAAEGSSFMQSLTDGALPRERFADLVAQQWFVYDALETAADRRRDDGVVGPFLRPELDRRDALRRDLHFWLGDDGAASVRPTPETAAYCDRLRAMQAWDAGLVAHHYVRYLGDLSGGQMIRRVVQRTYGLERAGVEFFHFDGIPDAKAFKAHYRQLLDRAPWDQAEQAAIIAEVLVAYRLNTELLRGL